ncbi:GH16715 [Drosophila grimshawi]|uniref:GH16715 n=1 Tax=Drosophila grimshawi TaxID=7222 RepID=B4J3B0_DROGR|nr:GH16715 [Drosophila grimshawi]
MVKICSYWPGTGYIGDSSDCQGWGHCANNKLTARGQCPDSRFFDVYSGTCQQAHLVRCAPQHWELCAKRQSGEYVADPLDCRKYKICDDEWHSDADDELNYCAEGYVFSNSLQTCVSNVGGCPQETLDICAFMPNGNTLGDPLNCGLYKECQNGMGIPQACTAARYYNYKNGRCQLIRPKHCPSGEGDSYRPARNPPPLTDVSVCAKFYQDDTLGVQHISDAQTCYGYYTCNFRNAVARWHSCPWGTHFQWWSQKCVSPESYSCPYDRCGNLNAPFVSAINSGCTEYISCRNQISHRLAKCPEDYPYFDEKMGECVEYSLNYTVCFMNG